MTHVLRTVSIAVAGSVFLGATAASTQEASVRLGGAFGATYQPESRNEHLLRFGPTGSLHIGSEFSDYLVARLEVLGAYFPEFHRHAHVPCPGPFACHEPVGSVLLAGATGSLLLNPDPKQDPHMYYAFGGGVYHALEHPEEREPRVGWSVGFGCCLSKAWRGTAVEVRYHRIPKWGDADLWLLPISLHVSW